MAAGFVYFITTYRNVAPRFQVASILGRYRDGVGLPTAVCPIMSWQNTFVLQNETFVRGEGIFSNGFRYLNWLIDVPMLLLQFVIVLGITGVAARRLSIQFCRRRRGHDPAWLCRAVLRSHKPDSYVDLGRIEHGLLCDFAVSHLDRDWESTAKSSCTRSWHHENYSLDICCFLDFLSHRLYHPGGLGNGRGCGRAPNNLYHLPTLYRKSSMGSC